MWTWLKKFLPWHSRHSGAFMIPFRRNKGPLIAESCDRPGLRLFVLVCLFAMTMSAFWWNFERRLEDIKPAGDTHAIMNEDHVLSKEHLPKLYQWRESFSKTWNIPLLLQASQGALVLPPYAINTLYVGVGMAHHEAVVAVPPLVRKVMGEGARLQAEEGLRLCLQKEAAHLCLNNTLQAIWDALEQ